MACVADLLPGGYIIACVDRLLPVKLKGVPRNMTDCK